MQLVKFERFTVQDLQTPEGVARLQNWMDNVTQQVQAMNGNSGNIKPDGNIDMGGKYKVINQAP